VSSKCRGFWISSKFF